MGVHPRWPHHPLQIPNGIVGEAMMAMFLAGAFLEKFGGDSLEEIRRNYDVYLASLKPW
jgi:chorismate synthase